MKFIQLYKNYTIETLIKFYLILNPPSQHIVLIFFLKNLLNLEVKFWITKRFQDVDRRLLYPVKKTKSSLSFRVRFKRNKITSLVVFILKNLINSVVIILY